MKKEEEFTMVGIDELEDVCSDRILTMEEVDLGLKNKNPFHRLIQTIESLKEKYTLYVVKEVMLQEMGKPYYENGAHVQEFIDIYPPNFVMGEGNSYGYYHIENLCIWQNGFYTFNRFNLTTPAIIYRRQKTISDSSK